MDDHRNGPIRAKANKCKETDNSIENAKGPKRAFKISPGEIETGQR